MMADGWETAGVAQIRANRARTERDDRAGLFDRDVATLFVTEIPCGSCSK